MGSAASGASGARGRAARGRARRLASECAPSCSRARSGKDPGCLPEVTCTPAPLLASVGSVQLEPRRLHCW